MAPPGASGGGCGAACQAAISDSLSEAIRDGNQNITVDSVRANWISGGVTCDSACQSTIGGSEGLLYKDVLSEITSLSPGSVGQVLQSRGEGLPPVFANPATVSAIVYGPGSDLIGNPSPINPDAKYVRVTDTTRIVAGSDFASNPVLADGTSRYVEVVQAPGIAEYDAGTSAAGDLRGIAYGAGLYVRVGLGGLIETSPDLVTWTTRTSGTTSNLNSITYKGAGANQGFWVVGTSARLYSADGVTWETKSTTGGNVITFSSSSPDRGFIGGSSYFVYITTDGGSTWTSVDQGDSQGSRAAAFLGDDLYYVTRNVSPSFTRVRRIDWDSPSVIIPVSSNFYPFMDRQMIVLASGRVVISGDNGLIYYSDTPNASASWVSVTVSGAGSLRLMEANGRVYAFGENGEMYVSADGGATWSAGPSSGVSTFLRFGVHDPNNPTRAIVVGNGGTMLIGQYPVVATTYPDLPASITLVGSVSFDLDALDPSDLPLNIDALRQFKSTVYASTADRSGDANLLGHTFDTYSETPLVVTIPGQIVFQIGVLTPADVPFDFDVYTFHDLIYSGLIVQNPSLNPGPYYCYNCVYDFGPDDRFEYGPESSNQYATVLIQNSTTGNFYFLRSTTAGDGGDPITWDTLMTITNEGVSMVPATQDWMDGDISINPYSEQVIYTYNGTPTSRTATLPALSTVKIGKRVCVSAGTSSITETYAITILPDGTDTINGSSSYLEINTPYGGYCLVSAGTTWVIQGAF